MGLLQTHTHVLRGAAPPRAQISYTHGLNLNQMRPRLLHRQCAPASWFSAATLAEEGSCSAWGGRRHQPWCTSARPGDRKRGGGWEPERRSSFVRSTGGALCPQNCPALGTCSGREEDLWGWWVPTQTARLLEGGPLRRGPLDPGKGCLK